MHTAFASDAHVFAPLTRPCEARAPRLHSPQRPQPTPALFGDSRSPAAPQPRSCQSAASARRTEPGAEQTTPGSAAPKPTAPLARRKPGPAASEGELSLSVCLRPQPALFWHRDGDGRASAARRQAGAGADRASARRPRHRQGRGRGLGSARRNAASLGGRRGASGAGRALQELAGTGGHGGDSSEEGSGRVSLFYRWNPADGRCGCSRGSQRT